MFLPDPYKKLIFNLFIGINFGITETDRDYLIRERKKKTRRKKALRNNKELRYSSTKDTSSWLISSVLL